MFRELLNPPGGVISGNRPGPSSEVMCSTIEDASAFQMFQREILLTRFPTSRQDAETIVGLSSHTCHLIAAVDHFQHAEWLSLAARRLQRQQRVVIEVDAGAGRTGVRPGQDAFRLALALSRLPDLRLCGLFADLGTGPTVETPARTTDRMDVGIDHPPGTSRSVLTSPIADPIRIADGLSMLQHTQQIIRQAGLDCGIISVLADGLQEPIIKSPVVTEVCIPECRSLAADLSSTVDSCPAVPGPLEMREHTEQQCIQRCWAPLQAVNELQMSARVLSRPSLQQAIAGVGLRSLRERLFHGLTAPPESFVSMWSSGWKAQVVGKAGAHITRIGPDSAVLQVTGESQDLTIGDSIEILWMRETT